jgi:hypothetical protein
MFPVTSVTALMPSILIAGTVTPSGCQTSRNYADAAPTVTTLGSGETLRRDCGPHELVTA